MASSSRSEGRTPKCTPCKPIYTTGNVSGSSTQQASSPYDLVIDSVHLRCVGLVDVVVFRAVNAEHHCLLEHPRGDVPRQLRISRGYAIGERLPCVLVAKELNAAREDDTRVLGRLETCYEAEMAAGPETLAGLLSGVNDCAGIRVVSGVGCKARRGRAEDGDEVGTVAERMWGTGEPDGGGACGEDGRLGDLHGNECRGLFAFGVVRDERCPWGRRDEGELSGEGGKRGLFWRERDEEVGVF